VEIEHDPQGGSWENREGVAQVKIVRVLCDILSRDASG